MIEFDCRRGMRNCSDLSSMQIQLQGKIYAKHLSNAEKQFEKVNNYTSKALIKLS